MISDLQTLGWLAPEIWLVAVATGIILAGAFWNRPRLWATVAVTAYLVAAAILCRAEASRWTGDETAAYSGPLISDSLGFLWRHLALLVGALLALQSASRPDQRLQCEIQGLLMLLTVGVMLTTRANELALAFVSLELVSIPTYVLLFLGRRDRQNSEATTKYFYLSILASAIFLYGLSYVYGIAASTWITAPKGPSLHQALSEPHRGLPNGAPSQGVARGSEQPPPAAASSTNYRLSLLGIALVLAGLGFKIAAVPFHFYAPDVYQGTSHTNASILAVAPKIAGLAIMVRLLVTGFSSSADFVWQAALSLAIITMSLGNVCALWQKNLRRLMAYSSIAHAGYLLIGIAVATAAGPSRLAFGGVAAVSFYLFAYAFATIGVFATFEACGSPGAELYSVEQLSGLSRRHPWYAAGLALFLLSLAGVPPLLGFWGKLSLFLSAVARYFAEPHSPVAAWFIGLAVVGALNAAIAAAYYLRIIGVMYFGTPVTAAGPPTGSGASAWPLRALILVCVVLILGLGLEQRPLSHWAQRAEKAIENGRALRPIATASLSRQE